MPSAPQPVLIDDRLLIEELLVGLPSDNVDLHTTSYWYYRACRAAMLGAGGHLSGPFDRLEGDQQQHAILSLLELRPEISLPDPRPTLPQMARLARRYPYPTPTAAAKAALDGKPTDGWLRWRVPRLGYRTLAEVRDTDV